MENIINKSKQPDRIARHCMVVHAYYPLAETRVEREAKALIEHGTEVDVICLLKPAEAAKSIEDGVEVYRLPVKRHRGSGLVVQFFEYLSFFILAFFYLTKLHWRKRYNVIQVHNLPDFLVFVALIPKLMGAKIIIDLHDLMPEFYAERFQKSMDSLLVRIICWQEWLSCRFADHIITVTELWRQSLIKRGQPANKISVVMNVADDHIFYPNAAPNMHIDNHFHLIYHGILGQRQGLDLLLRAIHQIRHIAPDIYLTLHGAGEYRKTLESLVHEMGLHNHVYFSKIGLTTAELPKLLKTADLGIVPYRNGIFTGGILPTKLLEYAALGIPVIAARTTGISAYFDDTTVLFFTPGNVDELAACILILYRDRIRLAEFAQNITKFNEFYNGTRARAEYIKLIDHLSVV